MSDGAIRGPKRAAIGEALHDRAVAAGHPVYADPCSGYLVMTSATLLARGHCCGSMCRHCPYPTEERRRAGRLDAE